MKKILKNRIFIFILGLFIASSISVLAATYFESSAVTYDNKESGLSSTDVQGAIDELYNACIPKGPLDGTIFEDEVVTKGDGLYEDEYEEGRFFYKGASPNNWIIFNEESWRIISVEPDKTIKIIRIGTLVHRRWDDSNSSNWAKPSELNTYLNTEYYSNLLEKSKNQIVAGDFSIGKIVNENTDLKSQIQEENSNKWNGKIGLPTASEYIRTNSDKNNCGTFSLNNYNYEKCQSTSWILSDEEWWTITPTSTNNIIYIGLKAFTPGYMYSTNVKNTYGPRPVVYLSSKTKIIEGNGSWANPYRFE